MDGTCCCGRKKARSSALRALCPWSVQTGSDEEDTGSDRWHGRMAPKPHLSLGLSRVLPSPGLDTGPLLSLSLSSLSLFRSPPRSRSLIRLSL